MKIKLTFENIALFRNLLRWLKIEYETSIHKTLTPLHNACFMTKSNLYYFLAWALIVIGATITVWYLFLLKSDGWHFISNEKVDIEKSGQFGDYIGGFVGTVFSLAGFIFLFLTLKEQRQAFKKERFENHFFELLKLHRSNVSELSYTKYSEDGLKTSTNRKVMRVIFQEFIECYREVKKFSNSVDPSDYLNLDYLEQLKELKHKNKINATIIEMAIIDISYSIVFFGVGIEGETVLKDRFKKKYNGLYFYRLLAFLKLKPKEENKSRYALWEEIRAMKLVDLRNLMEEIYYYRSHIKSSQNATTIARQLLSENNFEKYYGGHQHRLGHYFRHLFQSYKFLTDNKFLDDEEKYFYGKTFRAQISTYEQALILVNSISSLGMKWEFKAEFYENLKPGSLKRVGLISRYHLIKNLPGNHFFGIKYKDYYPNVKYENSES